MVTKEEARKEVEKLIDEFKLYKELLNFCDEIRSKQKFKFEGNLEFLTTTQNP